MPKASKVARYPLRMTKDLANLPRHVGVLQHNVESVSSLMDRVSSLEDQVAQLIKSSDDLVKLMRSVDERMVNLKHELKAQPVATGAAPERVINNTVADNHTLDHFYKLFEDRFRGTEADVLLRVSEYLPLFKKLPDEVKRKPVVDIGCGRGEFLKFAKKNKLKAIGVDMNKSMVERANSLGYEAIEDDAISYLTKQGSGSLAAITGFHIVEHIPFESLMELFEEAYRCLAPGGFALFETPNPNNIMVGASNFYMDPSHIKPIPPELLAFAMESVGFNTEILRVHPVRETIEHEDPVIKDVMVMMYGARDYAVAARKV